MTDLRRSSYQQKKSSRKEKVTTAPPARSRSGGLNWTPEEDSLLRDGVYQFGGKSWKSVSSRIERRSPEECSERWANLQGLDTVVKRPWSEEEDVEMLRLVDKYGASKWSVIASHLKDRNGKQCRERWHNQLNPAIKKSPWTEEEDAIILRWQAQWGNSWAKIATALPGRTDNSVKNHWHSSLKSLRKSASGGVASLRGNCTKSKRCDLRRKSRKVKSAKKENDTLLLRSNDLSSCVKARVAAPTCAAGETIPIAAPVTPFDNALTSSTKSLASVATSTTSNDGCGSLSPDAVSNVDNIDLHLYSCNRSYEENVLKAQTVIDNILDPLGMGSRSNNLMPTSGSDSCSSDATTFNHTFQNAMATWHANDDSFCRSASSDLSSDPTSPAQPPFGLDELLFDSLHDICVCDDDLQSSGASVQNAPAGEVARVYRRSMFATEWGTCITYASPSAAAAPPTPTYIPPNLSPIDQVDDSLTPLGDTAKYEIPGVESSFAQGISATFTSLLDMEI